MKRKNNRVFSDNILKPRVKLDISGDLGTKELKKQMLKVFQQANRRIQNVTSKGYASSAVESVIAERGKRDFTYFSGKGLDPTNKAQWERLKFEYLKAESFLSNPTSSATGAKQYIQWQAERLNTSFEQANRIVQLATSAEITGTGEMNILNYSNILNSYQADNMLVQDDSEESLADRVEKNLSDMFKVSDEKKAENELLDSFYNSDGKINNDMIDKWLSENDPLYNLGGNESDNDDIDDLTDLIGGNDE